MPVDLPLSVVVVEVVKRTPPWVWVILFAVVVLGSLQLRDHTVRSARLALMPIGLGAYSLWGATSLFGATAGSVAAWLAGSALALSANAALRWPRGVRWDADRRAFALRGSVLPLALMLCVFAVRYVVTVTLVFHPEWRSDAGFASAASATYGALSGLFAARALRILHASPAAQRWAAA